MSNASDFFGGGVPNRGEFNIPLASSLDGLSDVTLTTPSDYQSLVYVDGYWVNQTIQYANISGAPNYTTLSSFLGAMTDVDVVPLNTGDVLLYNASNVWEATTLNNLITLEQISGVKNTLNAPLNAGQVLMYTAGEWQNIALTHSHINFTDYTPDVSAVNIEDLANVPAPTADGYFQWDGTGTNVTFVTTIPYADIDFAGFDLSTFANQLSLSELNDVSDALSPSSGHVLTYSGGQWISAAPAAASDPSKITDGDAGLNECYIDTDQIADSIVIHAGPTTGDIILEPNGTGTIQIVGSGDAVIESDDNVLITSNLNDVILQGITYPKNPTLSDVNKVLTLISTTEIGFTTPAAAVSALDDLSDVVISGVANNDFLIYDTSAPNKWVNKSPTLRLDGIGVTVSIDDVLITGTPGINENEVLKWNGTDKWINAQLSYSNISGTPTLTLDQLSTVVDTATATGASLSGSGVLYYRTSGTPAWDAKKLSHTDITMTDLTLSTFTNTMGLLNLSDVEDLLSPSEGHFLYRNATEWTSKALVIADIIDFPDISPVGQDNLYTSLTNAPFTLNTTFTVDLKDLEDVENYGTVTDGHVLTWSTLNTRWEPQPPATTVTQLSQLTGDVVITAPTDNQILVYDTTNPTINRWKNTTVNVSMAPVAEVAGTITLTPADVNVTGPLNTNQVLKWDGTDWVNAQLSYSNISGTPNLALNFLNNVDANPSLIGDQMEWDGSNWVAFTPTIPYRIDDTDAALATGAFVDVGTSSSNVLISAGDGGVVSGGNIILTPNTTTNTDAAVVIEGDGGTDVYILSDDTINIQSTSAVNIQGITYPDTDGSAGYVLTTDGAGSATFQAPLVPTLFLKNYKHDLTMSYVGTDEISISSGVCRDKNNVVTMQTLSPLNKKFTNIGWVAGSSPGNNGLPSSVPLISKSYYYVFLIAKVDLSGYDVAYDNNRGGTNILVDSNVTAWAGGTPYIRRVGTIFTPYASTSLIEFDQVGDIITLRRPYMAYYQPGTVVSNFTPATPFSSDLPDTKIEGIFVFQISFLAGISTFEILVGDAGIPLSSQTPFFRRLENISSNVTKFYSTVLNITKATGRNVNFKFNPYNPALTTSVSEIIYAVTAIMERWDS